MAFRTARGKSSGCSIFCGPLPSSCCHTVKPGPSDLGLQNNFGGRPLHVASISENPSATRRGAGGGGGGWVYDYVGVEASKTFLGA